MSDSALPSMVLIGTSSLSESAIGRDFASGDDPLLRIRRGFGSFRAAVIYLKEHPLPDLVHIANNTCMPGNDLENGCRSIAEVIVAKTGPSEEPPTIIIEDFDLRYLGGEFVERGLRVEFGSLLHLFGYTEVESKRFVR
jgi:hypothetical protein